MPFVLCFQEEAAAAPVDAHSQAVSARHPETDVLPDLSRGSKSSLPPSLLPSPPALSLVCVCVYKSINLCFVPLLALFSLYRQHASAQCIIHTFT